MITWPDGGCYLEQPLLLVAAFDRIGIEWRKLDPKK